MKEIRYVDENKKTCIMEVFPLEPKMDKEDLDYIIKLAKKDKVTKKEIKEFVKRVAKDEESFIHFTGVMDRLERGDPMFSAISSIHLQALELNSKYRKIYDTTKVLRPQATFYPGGEPTSLEKLATRIHIWNGEQKDYLKLI